MNRIVIYCSASGSIERKYNDAARDVVAGLCQKGYTIVSGGTILGTMGVVSDTVLQCGGHHRGVLPRFMEPLAHKGLTETVWTDTMARRKEEMRSGTVAAIALPGGIGTLDELIETLVLKKLGRYEGRVIVLNIDGFFNPLLALLDHYVETAMLARTDRALIECFNSAKELTDSF